MNTRAKTRSGGATAPAAPRHVHDNDNDGAPPPPPPRRAGVNSYLYGIIRWPAPKELTDRFGRGVGDPPGALRVVPVRELAALVSDVSGAQMQAQGLRGTRRDMKAHAAAVNDIAASITLLPVRFGVVLPDDRTLISGFLEPQYKQLLAYLDQVEGAVEVTLRATSIEEPTLRAVVAERPELASGRRGGASMAHESRIEHGRQVAAAIHDLQDRDARWIVDNLAPTARDIRIAKPLRDLMALNASFLVERKRLTMFDRTLEKLNAAVGHRIQFDCVGPLAPYSFVDLRL